MLSYYRNGGQSNMVDVEVFKTNSLSLSNLIYLTLNQSTIDFDLQLIDDYHLLGFCLNTRFCVCKMFCYQDFS